MASSELISAFGALAVAAVAFLTGRYYRRGRIATSEAADLWQAAEHMRAELACEIKDLRQRVMALEREIAEVHLENENLLRENLMLREYPQMRTSKLDKMSAQEVDQMFRRILENHGADEG